MPCTDGGPTAEEEASKYYNNLVKVEAMLCAVLSRIEDRQILNEFLDTIDWREAGISKVELLAWWKNHKAQDKRRRELEQKKE